MTKDQELRALEAFIASLPQNTYLRPWLAAVLPEVRAALRQDILPQETVIGPAACYDAIAQARSQAGTIVLDAKQLAKEMLEQARLDAQEFRTASKKDAAKELRKLADKLDTLVL